MFEKGKPLLLLPLVLTLASVFYLTQSPDLSRTIFTYLPTKQTPDDDDNYRAISYLRGYARLFSGKGPKAFLATNPGHPNKPKTIKMWWQAAALIDWYLSSDIQYNCSNIMAVGNRYICQDESYAVKPPCLVYSFGISPNDSSFDRDIGKLGCEIHYFGPRNCKTQSGSVMNVTCHNFGLGNLNTDLHKPRPHLNAKNESIWTLRTLKRIIKDLGHEDRVIDVLTMDIEGYEWEVVDNMVETGVINNIRQLFSEYHILDEFPLKEEYVSLYRILRNLRATRLREFAVYRRIRTISTDSVTLEAGLGYVNTLLTIAN